MPTQVRPKVRSPINVEPLRHACLGTRCAGGGTTREASNVDILIYPQRERELGLTLPPVSRSSDHDRRAAAADWSPDNRRRSSLLGCYEVLPRSRPQASVFHPRQAIQSRRCPPP